MIIKENLQTTLEGDIIPPKGRPVEYTPELADSLRQFMATTGRVSISAVCTYLDIVPDTFYRWKELYPEFKEAYEKGHNEGSVWWLTLLQGIATGAVKGNITAVIYATANLFPQEFKQRQTESNVTVTVTSVSQLSDAELDKQIRLKEEKVKKLLHDN